MGREDPMATGRRGPHGVTDVELEPPVSGLPASGQPCLRAVPTVPARRYKLSQRQTVAVSARLDSFLGQTEGRCQFR